MPQSWPVKNPPQTPHVTSHGIQIKVRGKVVGSITNLKPGIPNRAFTQIYELNPLSSGHIIDQVPGNLTGFEVTCQRADIWNEPFELAFGGDMSIYEAIGNQNVPFELYEYLWFPNGYKRISVYRQTWIRSVSRTYDTGRDRVVLVDGSFVYVRKDRIA